MNSSEALEKLLPAFEKFYTVKRQDVVCPFDAEAEFCLHTEKYVLVKAAKIADIDSNELVYFSSQKKLDFDRVIESYNNICNDGSQMNIYDKNQGIIVTVKVQNNTYIISNIIDEINEIK